MGLSMYHENGITKSVLLSSKLKMLKGDPSISYCYKNDKLSMIVAIHVDIIPAFSKMFVTGKTSKNAFRYLGLELNENLQIHNINLLKSLNQKLFNNKNTISDIVQSAVGKQSNLVCDQPRPDISFEVYQLATHIKNSGESFIKNANKLSSNMKQNECKLIYQKLGNDNDLRIIVYSDAPQGNLTNGGRQGGDYIIFLCGYQNMYVPLNWQSKHIRRVVQRSLAAEALASSDVLDDAAYLMKLFAKVVFNNNYKIPIEVVIDNKLLYESLLPQKNVIEKCLCIDVAFIKENINNQIISKVHLVSSRNQLANVLTKKGVSSIELLNVLKSGIISIQYFKKNKKDNDKKVANILILMILSSIS